jgi:hypothetical protein
MSRLPIILQHIHSLGWAILFAIGAAKIGGFL